jgi:hypothetical protein
MIITCGATSLIACVTFAGPAAGGAAICLLEAALFVSAGHAAVTTHSQEQKNVTRNIKVLFVFIFFSFSK